MLGISRLKVPNIELLSQTSPLKRLYSKFLQRIFTCCQLGSLSTIRQFVVHTTCQYICKLKQSDALRILRLRIGNIGNFPAQILEKIVISTPGFVIQVCNHTFVLKTVPLNYLPVKIVVGQILPRYAKGVPCIPLYVECIGTCHQTPKLQVRCLGKIPDEFNPRSVR